MPNKTDLALEERLSLLSPEYQEFAFGDIPETTITIFSEVMGLNEVQRSVFENGYLLFLMLFFNKYDLMEFLVKECSVSAHTAVTTVQSILTSTPKEILLAIEVAYKSLNAELEPYHRMLKLQSKPVPEVIKYIESKNQTLEYVTGLGLDIPISSRVTDFFGDILLGIHSRTEVEPFIQFGLDISDTGLQEKLKQIIFEALDSASAGSTPNTFVTDLESEISQTEKEIATLQTVRTMPHDMAAIKPGSDTVYQSSQADILTRNSGEVPNIASAVPEAPRWDTDTKQ